MTIYVWTAKNQFGHIVVREVAAESAEAAKTILLAQGYSEPVLKEDDIIAAARAGFPEKITVLGEEVKVSLDERIKGYDAPPATFWSSLKQGINESKLGCFILIAAAAFAGYRGNWTTVVLLMVALVAWLAFILCVCLPSIYYRKLHVASDWNRWNEMLSLVNTLRTIGRFSYIKVPESELIRNRAKALTGLGRLDEALAEYNQFEGRPDCPSWLHKLHVGSLYVTAKHYDKAIECNLLSIAEKPTSTAWADLANRYARYQRDPAKARAAMAEADKSPIPEFAKPFRIRCLGIIAYLEGDFASAKRELETAIDMVEKAKGRPFRDGHLAVARAYLGCVLAKQGDSAGKRHFALAKEYLIATHEDELLAECRKLMGD